MYDKYQFITIFFPFLTPALRDGDHLLQLRVSALRFSGVDKYKKKR